MADRDPRLSGPTLKVLRLYLMTPREERSGAEISKSTGVGAGTLYPMLARLEEAGWFDSEWENIDPKEAGRPRRRFYRLTGLGETRARAALSEFQMPIVQRGEAWAS
ncbi:PadR family transcriptional regulator [Methylobacterium sp. OT2]|uniref:PadR family transcriptional regulator n=1 Tax=Methylobacterium sp. OT2 TaxID=2813779 RepID=UPI00197C1C89|nr:PadR family transcriptional regulator [Methylobacterium sp. OT2]MBN4095627.1 PadR family transcriptional regulator [Methylobacterium sp. OT2]